MSDFTLGRPSPSLGEQAGAMGRPYWWDAAPPQTKTGPLPKEVDVLVVGSGFTGLSAALTLARSGRSVLVCDAAEIGHGASTRNGGHVSAKMRRGLDSIAKEHGEDAAIDAWNTAKASRTYIEDLVEREKIDCDFRTCARFYGAHKAKDFDGLAKTTDTLTRKLGLNLEVVQRTDQHHYIATDVYHGGLLDKGTAGFHPAKFIAGLCDRVEQAGGILRSHTKVEGYDRVGDGFRVSTSRGEVRAAKIVIGTNGYTRRELPYFARRIVPIGSYLIATEPLGREAVERLMPGCELAIDTRRAASYMRMSPDRTRMMYGGRVAARQISAIKSGPRLKAVLDNIFPSLKNAKITHSWMGFTGFTFDELPHLGHRDGVYYAMGYCGTGTAMATYLGHRVALSILGQNERRSVLERIPLKTNSLYRGKPWFLSTLIAGYRLLDKLHI